MANVEIGPIITSYNKYRDLIAPYMTNECLSGIFFMVTSGGMTLLNKTVISVYGFNYPNIIMTMQMLVTVFIFRLLWLIGIITQELHLLKDDKQSICFVAIYYLHTILSLNALHGLNIPIYGAIKRCSSLMNLILSVAILKKSVPGWRRLAAIFMITGGCIMAGSGDLHFDLKAYTFGFTSIVAQGLYMTLAEKLANQGNSIINLTYSCALTSFPLFFYMAYIFEEFQTLEWENFIYNKLFIVMFTGLTLGGTLLSLSLMLSSKINSALATSLLGSFKTVAQTICGFLFFPDVVPTLPIVSGITINIVGSFIYTHSKYQPEKKENSDEPISEA